MQTVLVGSRRPAKRWKYPRAETSLFTVEEAYLRSNKCATNNANVAGNTGNEMCELCKTLI